MGIAADFVLIVIAGLAGAVLARLLRLPLLVGYVAAGVVVGPYTAGPTVAQIHDIELLAEIGVALLLFSLGLEVSIADLAPVRRIALAGGALQVLLTAVVAAFGGMAGFGMQPVEAAWFGAAVSLSSTMVVLKTLSARGVTGTLASRIMIGWLVFQDLAVIPMLVILPQLGGAGAGQELAAKISTSVLQAAVILFATWWLGTRLFPPVLVRIIQWGPRELFLVAVVAVGVGTGYAVHAAGYSFALGAFLAGIILSEAEFSHQAFADLGPLRDIFGLLFFVTVGMLFDPAFLLAHPLALLLAILAIVTGKALIFGVITRLFGYGNHAPWIVGLGLAQVGEFSFVLARTGLKSGALSKSAYDLLLASTVLTMAISPVVYSAAVPLARRFVRRRVDPATPPAGVSAEQAPLAGHAIICGYGRTGRAAARVLAAAGVPLLVIESEYALYGDVQRDGVRGVWGDATSPEILHAAGIERARVLLVTMPDRASVLLTAERARAACPQLAVIARVHGALHASELGRLGVEAMVQPEFEGGVEMVRRALERLDIAESAAAPLVDDARRRIYG